MAKGIRRYEGGWRDHDSVLVRYEDGREMEMSAETYAARGIHPPLKTLPVAPSTEEHDENGEPTE